MARTPSKKRRKDGKSRVYAAGKYFESAISWSDANKKAQAYKREIEKGLNADAHNMTVKQYALRWLPLHKKALEDQEKAHQEHIATVRKVARQRLRWIILLAVLLIAFIFWFIWDLTHPENGLIRLNQMGYILGKVL